MEYNSNNLYNYANQDITPTPQESEQSYHFENTNQQNTAYNPHGYSFENFGAFPSEQGEETIAEEGTPIPIFASPNIALEKVSYVLDPQLYEEPIKEPVFWIETEKVKSNPYQPRRHFDPTALGELAESIKEYGILQPIVVSKVEKEIDTGTQVEYQLIAGERRLLAAKKIGLEHIPAVIKESREEREKLEMAIIENLQREELSPIEMARAYARLSDEFGLSQREISHRMGKSREAVSNTIRLLQLPYEAQKAIEDKKITESHARLMLKITNPEKQRAILAEILSRNLSVRETELVVNRLQAVVSSPQSRRQRVIDIDPAIVQLERSLEAVFGKPVSVERTGKKGKISISFYSDEELKELIERLIAQPLLTQQEQGREPEPMHEENLDPGEPKFSESEFQSEIHNS